MIRCRSALSLTVIVVSLLWVVGMPQRPVTGSPGDTSTPQDRSAEAASAQAWAAALQGGQAADVPGSQNVLVAIPPSPPFSFVLGGQESTQLLGVWHRESGEVRESGARSLQSTTWTDPQTKLQVRADVTAFRDFPAVEWVLHFTNTGTADTPILERILPLDSNLRSLQRQDGGSRAALRQGSALLSG